MGGAIEIHGDRRRKSGERGGNEGAQMLDQDLLAEGGKWPAVRGCSHEKPPWPQLEANGSGTSTGVHETIAGR